jgi:hypothetical protein
VSYWKHGIASESYNLAKAVLTLSTLGIFTKLLNVDLSRLDVLGVTFAPETSSLIPGFLGVALMYTFLAFCVARAEATGENMSDPAILARLESRSKSKLYMAFAVLGSPFSFVVYSMPLALGLTSILLLWSDSIAVLSAIWRLAFG